jgi:enoyl-CoA hydratase/carnithine racemase
LWEIMTDVVVREDVGAVAVLRLNRPPVNALSEELLEGIHRSVLAAADDPAVGSIVITGSDRAFVAGGDIELLQAADPARFRRYFRGMQQVWDEIEAVPVPTIAAIRGYALGGGCELALSCDLRFASDTARLGMPEVRLGLFPAAGGTARLARQVGKGRALEIVWTCRQVPADEALRIGLVEQVRPDAELLPAAVDFAAALAAGPRDALAAAKRCVLAGLDGGLRAELRSEVREVEALFGTPDNQEGLAAFLQRREPHFGPPEAAPARPEATLR